MFILSHENNKNRGQHFSAALFNELNWAAFSMPLEVLGWNEGSSEQNSLQPQALGVPDCRAKSIL